LIFLGVDGMQHDLAPFNVVLEVVELDVDVPWSKVASWGLLAILSALLLLSSKTWQWAIGWAETMAVAHTQHETFSQFSHLLTY